MFSSTDERGLPKIIFHCVLANSGERTTIAFFRSSLNSMSITELFREAAFDADATLCITAAFDRACASLREDAYSDLIKEIIAKRIIVCARNGMTDPDALSRDALISLGLHGENE